MLDIRERERSLLGTETETTSSRAPSDAAKPWIIIIIMINILMPVQQIILLI
jgi:hypothetical protein